MCVSDLEEVKLRQVFMNGGYVGPLGNVELKTARVVALGYQKHISECDFIPHAILAFCFFD